MRKAFITLWVIVTFVATSFSAQVLLDLDDGDTIDGDTFDVIDTNLTELFGNWTTLHGITGPVFSDGDGTYTDMSAISSTELGLLDGLTGPIYESGDEDTIAAAISAGALPADSVLPADLDQDGNYTSLTGEWATTGSITGAIYGAVDSDGITLTGRYLRGSLIVESGHQQTVLIGESAAFGKSFCVLADGADASAEIYVDCDAGDHFEYDGTTMADGEYIYNDSGLKGDRMCFVGIDADTWVVTFGGDTTVAEAVP